MCLGAVQWDDATSIGSDTIEIKWPQDHVNFTVEIFVPEQTVSLDILMGRWWSRFLITGVPNIQHPYHAGRSPLRTC